MAKSEYAVTQIPQQITIPLKSGGILAADFWPPALPDGDAAVFCHGFGSDRKGEKAVAFADGFARMGWGFLAFDFRGHGESSGAMEELTLTGLLEDLQTGLEWLPPARNPPLLIGSSMGTAVAAWHAFHNPQSVRGVVMIAPALEFPAGLIGEFSADEMIRWEKEGVVKWKSPWLEVKLGFGLVRDAALYPVSRLGQGYRSPTLMFHGLEDDAVDWRGSVDVFKEWPNPEMDLVLLKQGDHRLNSHKDFMFRVIRDWLP